MYYYILDLGNKEISKAKEKIESALAFYGIPGDLGKISPLSSAYELAKRAKDLGYTTIVAIGGAEIINQIASALIGTKITFGIIPFSAPASICSLLGTNSWKKAIEILRLRKIINIDVGKIKDRYFLTEAKIKMEKPTKTILNLGDFQVEGDFTEITVFNGREKRETFFDGLFDLFLSQEKPTFSILPFLKREPKFLSIFQGKNISLEIEEQNNVLVDNEVVAKTPCQFSLLPSALRLIISRRSLS